MKTEDVSTLLRRAIRDGVIRPGDDLVQEDIAGRLGVSRVPLREALRGLAAVGIVQMNPGRGFRVTKLNHEEIEELYTLRLQIEPSLAASVIDNISRPQIKVLASLDQKMRSLEEADKWSNHNYEFHLKMYEAAGGTFVLRIVQQLLDLVEPYSRMYVYELRNVDRVQDEHSRMVKAIEESDSAALSELIVLHLEGAREGLVKEMKAEPSEDPLTRLMS